MVTCFAAKGDFFLCKETHTFAQHMQQGATSAKLISGTLTVSFAKSSRLQLTKEERADLGGRRQAM